MRYLVWVFSALIAMAVYVAADAAGVSKIVAGGLMFAGAMAGTAIARHFTARWQNRDEATPPTLPPRGRGSGRRGTRAR